MATQIRKISDYPEIEKLFQHYLKLHRATHDSWPALFKTKEHKRRTVRTAKMALRFVDAVQEKFNIVAWTTKDTKQLGPLIVWEDANNGSS